MSTATLLQLARRHFLLVPLLALLEKEQIPLLEEEKASLKGKRTSIIRKVTIKYYYEREIREIALLKER